jgi:hypothetical protein
LGNNPLLSFVPIVILNFKIQGIDKRVTSTVNLEVARFESCQAAAVAYSSAGRALKISLLNFIPVMKITAGTDR